MTAREKAMQFCNLASLSLLNGDYQVAEMDLKTALGYVKQYTNPEEQ